jgi:hypothetical protein
MLKSTSRTNLVAEGPWDNAKAKVMAYIMVLHLSRDFLSDYHKPQRFCAEIEFGVVHLLLRKLSFYGSSECFPVGRCRHSRSGLEFASSCR